MIEIRDQDFGEFVLDADRPVLVDFWASWCPPCKMMHPVVERLSLKVADWADIFTVNIDRSPELAQRYAVSGVPTFIAFAGGQPVDRKTGALTEGQLMSLLNASRDAMPAASAEESDSSDHEPFVSSTQAAAELHEASEAAAVAPSFITIVSGLPRSGTSLMMRMLEAGGIVPLTDALRIADDDNPNGYYEFEEVKNISENSDWLPDAHGKAVKMVYRLLQHLPADREYRVIFMRRNVDEILQSQKKMLERNGVETDIPDAQMKALYERELRQFYARLPSQPHLKLINISYNDLLADPSATIHQLNRHLGHILNTDRMIQMVDPALYRHRAA